MSDSDSEAESLYFTPPSSLRGDEVFDDTGLDEDSKNAILMEAIEEQDKKRALSVLVGSNKWIVELKIWYLRRRHKVLKLKKETNQESQDTEEEDSLEEISFLEDCLHQFQERLITANASTATKHRVTPRKVGTSLKQLYQFKLPKEFVAKPIIASNTEAEFTLHANDQSLHYSFSSCFHQLMSQKYGHLDELDLFGDMKGDDKPGIIAGDFEADLRTCNQAEHYSLFFAKLFSQCESVKELQEHFKHWYEDFVIVSSPDQFQQEILNQVLSFCYYLIDSRFQTIELFEQYESSFHSKMCSYSKFKHTINNSALKSNLNEIAKDFEPKLEHLSEIMTIPDRVSAIKTSTKKHALLNVIESLVIIHQECSTETTQEAQVMRESILKVEVELYRKVLEVVDINQKATEQVKQCLEPGFNHFAYLHQHLSNLCELLKTVLHPYTVTPEKKDTHTIYTVTMVVGSISGALSAFREWLDDTQNREYSLVSGDKLRLCADTVLFLDSDVKHDYLTFQGVSVALIAPKLSYEKGDKICVRTDGKQLENVSQEKDAISGSPGTEKEKDGQPGKDGDNGDYGNAGGHILIVSGTLHPDKFEFSAKASQGQDGQNGGDGGDGWSPPKKSEGRDGSDPEFESGRLRTEDSVVIQYGTYGPNGGQGGDAGMGGAAGKSGISGKIEFIDLENETNCKTVQEEVEDGKPGEPGKPGKGGRHARHGVDWGKYASALGFGGKFVTFFTTTRPNDSIASIKGELEHSKIDIKKKTGFGKKFETKGAKGLPRQCKQEDHPDFKDRGSNRDGETAQVKVNTAVAKENKAIDKNACLMTMIALCRQTRSHWNDKSHHNFLKSFANKIDTSYEGRYVTLTRSERIKAGRDMWVDCILKLSGKTEVSVAYSREQTQRASVQVMKNFEAETRVSFSRSISYLGSERDIDVQDAYIDISAFKDRAEEKEVECNDLSLEPILTSDEYDNCMKHFLSKLGLSENYTHIVVVADSEKAKEFACKYDFLIVNNKEKRRWFLYHTRGKAIVNIDDESLIELLDQIDGLTENETVSMETIVHVYDNVIKRISTTLTRIGAESSAMLPCTADQIHCVRQFNLVTSIKRSYKALYRMCDEILIHLFQSTYAEFLYQVLESDSSLVSSLKSCQDNLQKAQKYFIMPIDTSWLDGNTARLSQQATKKLKTACENFNKEYTLKGLLAVIKAFVYYDTTCCAWAKEEYSNFLSKPKTLASLKTFITQLTSTLELFGTQSIEIPDQDFELSTIQEILQRVAIPSHKQTKVKEYTSVELCFCGVVTIPQSSIAKRVIGSTLTDLSTKMQQLWNLALPSQVSEVTLLRSKESFKQKCNIFRTNPSMKELPEVMLSYSELKPLLSDCKNDIEYLLMFAFDQIHACLVDIKQKKLYPCVTSYLESSVTELEHLQQGIKAIPEVVTQAQALGFLLKQLHALLLKSQGAIIDSEEQLLDPATLLITVSKMLPEMFEYYDSLFYFHRQEKEKERQTALKWIPVDVERIRALTAILLQHPMACPIVTLLNWKRIVKEILRIVALKPALYKDKKDENDIKIYQGLVALHSELKKCSESVSLLVELRQNLDLAVFAADLNMYNLLYSEDDRAKAITQTCLGLNESFIEAGYLKHFSEWLQPGLLGLSMGELTVSMERLSPQQELLILSKKPKIIPENTIVLLATDNGGWKTCCRDTTPAQTCQYSDISPEVLNDILNILEIEKIVDFGEVELTVEKKAEILRKLEFERELDEEIASPQQDLLVLFEEPEEIPENTIILLTKNDGTWQTCSKNITPILNQSFQYRDVSPEIINDILGRDAHQRVTDNGKIEPTIEKKAKILGKLKFEQEFSVICNVQFCGQTIISEVHCKFLLAEIDLTSNEILLEKEQQTEKKFTNDKAILLFCHSNQLETVKLPYLQDNQKELYSKRESFLCIVRHPSQPAIIKSVSNCGDQVTLSFSYSTPLATNHQPVTSSTFIQQVRPIVSLLNRYQDLYQIHLPIHVLREKLADSLKSKETFFEQDITKLTKNIQQNFLKSLLSSNATIEDDLGNLNRIVEVKEEIFKFKGKKFFIKGLLLTGLELFLCFILVQNAKLVESLEDTDIYRFHQYWQYIRKGKSLSKSEAENLLTAFAYIRESQTVDEGLSQESAAVRSQAYTMIKDGLQLFEYKVHRDKSLKALTKQLCDKASNFMKMVKIEIIWDCSKKLKEDDRCLPSLFSMIHSLEQLAAEVMQLPSLHDIEADEEKCLQCLESPSFFVNITDIVLFWCTNQMHHFFQEFQLGLVSSQAFLGLTPEGNEIETAVHAFTSWAMSGLEAAFTRNDWESIHQHIKIAGILAMEVSVLVQKGEYPDSVLYLSTVIRMIRMSDNLADTSYILENFPNDQWLKYLIVSNFLFVLDSYYSTKIDDSLHDQLVHSETKLLQIFYNVFVNDQYNQTSDSPCEDLAGFISLEQVSVILNWLHLIEPCPNANTVLCRTSLALWEKELIEIYFKQYIEHWTDITEADKQKTVYLMKRVRLDTGINHSDFIALLCTVRRKYIESASKNSAGFLEMFEDLYYGRISLEQVRAMVFGHKYNQWKEQLEATKRKKREKCEPRTVSDVLDLIEIQVKSGDYDIATEQFELIKREASDIVSLIHRKVDAVTIDQLDEEFFGLLRRNGTIEEKMEWLVDKDHRVKFVANIVLVLILFTSETPRQKVVPYNSQIVSLLLFLHARNDKGLLQQVKTGEGKTLIVAMLAAAKALLGYHVDIVSSNRDLAQDGMRKCQPFFECLGLQAAVNCTEDDNTNQQAYKSHIVYGDVGSFQRDVLTEECEPGGTSFSARYANLTRNCLIVDEVDSMFLDKGQHMLYLSHETAALKHLETLFIMIWSAVLSVSQENELLISQVISQLEHKLGILIDNGTITIPDYLMDFCKKKLSSWIRSAYEACFMDANDQFIIDSKDSHVKQIFPIDKQTGIEQYNMKWTDGLSQFLELKYQRPLSTESLRAVFISNKRFFKRYDKQLFGLTGTLGSLSSRSLLQNVYSIKNVEIPTNRPKRYIQTKSRVATNSKMWCEQVKMEVLDIITEQPVLVICNNIKQLNSVKKYLKADSRLEIVESGDDRQMNPSFGTKLTIEIIDYARDGDDVENRFDKQGALPGQLILATNKGGRGTDIKIDEGKVPKGLHVIVSFLPENTRIEEQAFGRAARAGQAGSGCLIIQINQRECQQTLRTFETVEVATETLVEIEKIKRNRAETERLTILLVQGIPKLDMEEQLYTSFQEHKKALTSVLDEAKLFEVHVNATKHIKKACQTIVTNQWAFWLESVRAQIRSADDPDKRQVIVEMFNEEFPCKDLSPPSSEPHSTWFRMPEDYIQLGQAYLKEIQYLLKQNKADKDTTRSLHKAALTCFERAYDCGDKTGLAAMAACYCFVQLNPEASKDNKKKVRLFLKQAKSQLITLKQGWMGNIEVSKALSDLVDVSQYVEKSENHYALQIEGKLKVIGLHLHTIEILLGRPVEESSFVNESSLKVEMISVEQSTELYHIFCSKGIICHNKVRSCWKKREKLESLITKDVEPTIAEGLIELILEKTNVYEDDLSHLVYSSEELWDILEPLLGPSQVCLVFKVQQIDEKLSDNEDLLSSWRVILNQICDGSSECTQCVLPADHPVYKGLQSEEYKNLISFLQSNGLCIDTRRGELKDDASAQILTINLGKFEKCQISDEHGEEQSLCEFLAGLISHCVEEEDGYLYEYMLPYGNKSQEAKKIHAFLHECDILKSGGLAVCEYDSENAKFESLVEKTLGTGYTKEQSKFIVNVLRGLKGEVRKFERNMQIAFVSFYDLKDHPEDIPEELNFFKTWHMDYFLSLEQKDKGWWDWNAFACAMLGLAQVVAGVALVPLTAGLASHISTGLITEGINDMVYATMAGLTGTFSWKDYAIQKAISVAITIVTGGLGALTTPLKVAAKVGSAARFSAFVKTAAKAAGVFAMGVVTGILSDVVLADVQRRVVDAIVEYSVKKMFPLLREKLRAKLMEMAKEAESDDAFYSGTQRIISELNTMFNLERSKYTLVFDDLRSHIVSFLTQHCRGIADNLSQSNSKWAKLVGTGAKAAFFVDKIFTMVQEGVSLGQTAIKLVTILNTKEALSSVLPWELHSEELRREEDINQSIFNQELDRIEECFKEFIRKQLQERIRKALNIAIRKSLKLIAVATKSLVRTSVEKAFNGMTTADLVKDMKENAKTETTVIGEHENEAIQDALTSPNFGAERTAPEGANESKQRAFIKKRDDFQETIVEPCRKQQQHQPTTTTSKPSVGIIVDKIQDKVETQGEASITSQVVSKPVNRSLRRAKSVNCKCKGRTKRQVMYVAVQISQSHQGRNVSASANVGYYSKRRVSRRRIN